MFYPFFRAHKHIDAKNSRLPYEQKSNVKDSIKNSLNLRYTLIHYM